jgi:hypothetical protein
MKFLSQSLRRSYAGWIESRLSNTVVNHGLPSCQRGDEVAVNEQEFGRWNGEVFETLDIFEAWLRSPVPVA